MARKTSLTDLLREKLVEVDPETGQTNFDKLLETAKTMAATGDRKWAAELKRLEQYRDTRWPTDRAKALEQKAASDAAEREAVAEQLREHRDRLKDLLDLVSAQTGLSTVDKERARGLLAVAKVEIRRENDRLTKFGRQGALNVTEDAYLRPAIQEATAHVKARVNADPSRWTGDLSEAIMDLEHYLNQIIPTR